MKLSRTSHQ